LGPVSGGGHGNDGSLGGNDVAGFAGGFRFAAFLAAFLAALARRGPVGGGGHGHFAAFFLRTAFAPFFFEATFFLFATANLPLATP
jgi:hypothetical protein